MKIKNKPNIDPSTVASVTPSITPSIKSVEEVSKAIELIKDIQTLTAEDIILVYAYAEAIVETVREPLIILDKDLRIKTANKSFFDTFKVSKEETYNNFIFDLGNKQWDIPKLRELLKQILSKDTQFYDYEITHAFEDVGTRVMLLNARRIILEGHETELILLAIEDITKRKILERQKDDFISFASHELKTPLTSIKVMNDLLLSSNLETRNKKNVILIEKIARQINRMQTMISSFLSAQVVNEGKMELNKKRFLIDNLIKDTLKTFKYTTKTHSIELEGKSVKKVFADKERIEEVLINLLTNAIKYSPKADKILIRTLDNDNSVTISVQDFGLGIPKKQQSLIFDRFFRSRSKNLNKVKGLGLGLYIAHNIVEQHKGRMWVSSQVKKGTIFYFSLPTS